MFKHLGGFCIGATMSGTFVLFMDDLIYTQMRRHIIHPVQIMAMKNKGLDMHGQETNGGIEFNDIKQIGKGASAFF